MKRLFFGGVALVFLFLSGTALGREYQRTETGVKTSLQSMNVEIRFYSPSIVRVIKYPDHTELSKESFSVVKSPENTPLDYAVRLKSSTLAVELDLETGKVSYSDLQGTALFTEKDHGTEFTPFDDGGNPTFSVRQAFLFSDDEAIYGLGQQQYGKMNQRNQTLHLEQRNCHICIPFIQSVKGYGVFWDNYSPTVFEDNKQGMSFTSRVADCSDYYFMYGGNMDGVVARMRDLTGQAPLFPLWTWGYWQSKERYKSQEELVGIVRKYRELNVPLDGIIQDWQYWNTNNAWWNGMYFGNPEFPDPEKMMDDIHSLDAHAIISVWPNFGQRTEPYKEFREKGFLMNFPTYPTDSTRAYNPYSEEARNIYWKYLEKNILPTGVDGWWMDATEVEPKGNIKEEWFDQSTGPGSFRKVRNAYPLMTVEGVYRNQRAVSSDKRVFILTRSAFAGQQRAAANAWSGDIDGDWETFRKQIPAGLNFSACGIPYWNTDIGGFFVRNGRSSAHEDYRELYVRWLQFGAFCPMMRSHGTNTPREIWRFGGKGDWAYDAIEKFIRLRYRLLPYNYSMGWNVTSEAGSIIRMLAMDFPGDAKVHDMGTEYMWGKSFLVAPVTEPFYTSGEKENSASDFSKTQTTLVYLPKGADWFDFWTGEKLSGGTEVLRETPIDVMPLYVKAGSIVPMGPEVEYAEEKKWDDLEVRIYGGADAEFTLYEDENDNYNYEKGLCSTIRFSWDDTAGTLTIGERNGNFPDMLGNRKFRIVSVGSDKVTTVIYRGKKLTTKAHRE